jgi:hypothetical protein
VAASSPSPARVDRCVALSTGIYINISLKQ